MDTKNFKVFQRRGDQLHLGATISIGIITFNAIIVAIIAILVQYYNLVTINCIIRLIISSSVLALFNLFCIRATATIKIQTLIDKIDNEKRENTTTKNSNKKINKYWNSFSKGFFKFILSPYWKEIISITLSAIAFGMLITAIT